MIGFDRSDRLLVVAPHPDDEVVGCAGLIQKIKKIGGKAFVLFLVTGDTKDFSNKGLSTGSERESEIEKVAKLLKYDDYEISLRGNEYQLQLDRVGQLKLMNIIEKESRVAIEKVKPTIVVMPSPLSYNQDHAASARAAHACMRNSSPMKHFVPTVLEYEEAADQWTLSQAPKPNFFVPLSSQEFDTKIKALKLYSSQWREFPSSRSEKTLRALATLRGSFCNCEFAEGFYNLRVAV